MREQPAADTNRSVAVKGRYRVVGPGVAGSDAIIYAAEDVASRDAVALLVLRAEVAADAEFVTAVRELADRLAKPACQHRALVRVHDAGTTDDGAPFVALEAITGRSLRAMLDERGRLDLHDALRLTIAIGEGLETLHQSGIVHGELRPESVVLVTDEHGCEVVKLVGIELTAAHRTPAGLRNRTDAVLAYLAPEQITRAETTEAADIHALGLLILELVTGHRPDGAGSGGAPALPRAVARIVAKALHEGPGRRYSSISLMVNDMWSAQSAQSAQSPTRASGPPQRRTTARRRALTDVGMATALVVGLVLIGATVRTVQSDRVSRRAAPDTEAVVAASPLTPTPIAPTRTSSQAPARGETPAPASMKRVTGGAVASRPVVRQVERPASADQRSAGGADGTAIIDWLLKGGRSGD